MASLLEKTLPRPLAEYVGFRRAMSAWKKRGFLENAPQIVKESVFQKYAIVGAPWVETGTYLGTTTEFLRRRFPHVHSIEPEPELYRRAAQRFGGANVTLYNDVSEHVFPKLLPDLSGDLNFWLDGHYSAGKTFQGAKDCPVEDELNAIEASFDNFNKLAILVDDVRCFLPDNSAYADYPSIDYLVDWARKFKMRWRIEHDIFIMHKD